MAVDVVVVYWGCPGEDNDDVEVIASWYVCFCFLLLLHHLYSKGGIFCPSSSDDDD